MHLIDWVKGNVWSQPGSFVTTKSLYNQYKNATEETGLVTEDKFYKEIELLMFGLNIKPGRAKKKMGRGFLGIRLKTSQRTSSLLEEEEKILWSVDIKLLLLLLLSHLKEEAIFFL